MNVSPRPEDNFHSVQILLRLTLGTFADQEGQRYSLDWEKKFLIKHTFSNHAIL